MSSHTDSKPMASHLPVGETWIVVASQSQARIFRYLGLKSGLELVEKIQHPEGRLLDRELGADRPGRSFSSAAAGGRSSYSEERTPHEQQAWEFARRLAGRLKAARGRNEFRALMLVAESRFLGILKSCLDQQTQKILVATLDREYHQKSSSELSRQIQQYLLSA
ncbi:MAG: host attachment protein [Bdellovibrionales bacterium]|nr:host attachment protein [Bdellovibrionales bacterium]